MVSGHFRKYVLIIAVSCFISIGTSLHAQQVEISSSLNPVGSGARATGMGGAFIGVADDATAASWNPAGLIQLEKPEISAVYSYFDREHTYSSPTQPEIASTNSLDTDGLNYASIVYPFVLFNRNMVISLNYQRLFEMDKNNRFAVNRFDPDSTVLNNLEVVEITFVQDGYLYTLSPAMAVQLTPQLYIGGTLNFWDNFVDKNGWKNSYTDVGTASVSGFARITNYTQTQDISFKGTNAHLGFMWLMTDSLTLGGVYKTAFDADLNRTTVSDGEVVWPGLPPFPFIQPGLPPATITQEFTMKMPASYGLGLAYRHSDAWTLAFDVYRTEWEDFFIIDSMGNRSNPLDNSSDPLKSTTQVRIGTEYLFIRNKYVVPLRAGIFYDPEPAVGHLDDYYGFSLGTGYARGRVVVDASYQYRTGDNVSSDIPGVSGASADVHQHALLFSAIFYFE